ncbi:MAG: hypothetical protein H7A46_00840 [Verrucomicrobiales bacterium]|nr:hypothetical protein [Verrucomicrobiales bacterium]
MAFLALVGWRLSVLSRDYVGMQLTHPWQPPERIVPLTDAPGQRFDLGYATASLPTTHIDSVQVFGGGYAVKASFGGMEMLAIRPLRHDPDVFDQYFPKGEGATLQNSDFVYIALNALKAQPNADRLMGEVIFDYRWMAAALNTRPRSKLEFLLSSEADRTVYVTKTATSLNQYAERGVGLLETDYVRAIVYRGDHAHPGKVPAMVWSRNGRIGQAIEVTSTSWETSTDAMVRILSGLSYSMDEIPEEPAVKELVLRTAQSHERYVPNEETGLREAGR